MIRFISTFLFTTSIGALVYFPNFVLAFCTAKDCSDKEQIKNDNNKLNDFLIKNKSYSYGSKKHLSMEEFLIKNNIRIDAIMDRLIVEKKSDKIIPYSVDIESDLQYQTDDIFYAEGNVEIKFQNGILKAEKISFDKVKKVFTATENVEYVKANQFFEADKITYSFKTEYGELENVYAVLEIQNLGRDFNYEIRDDQICLRDIPLFINPVSEVEMLDTNNIRFKNRKRLDFLEFEFPSFTRWRLKSKKIKIKGNSWKSEQVFFSNDPFNKPQLIIESKDFEAKIFQNRTNLKSKSTFLIFEDKIRIPIGRRTINNNDGTATWGVSRDVDGKDGFYIYRNFETIKLNDFSLDMQPQYLIERHIKDKTNSFRAKDSSLNSDKVENDIFFSDLFALDIVLRGQKLGWDFYLDSKFNSLNIDRFTDSQAKLLLSKSLIATVDDETLEEDKKCYQNDSIKEDSNYNLDLGLYSLYRRERIYSAYGAKLMSNYEYSKDTIKNKFFSSLDLGQYHAESSQDKQNVDLFRYGFLSSFSTTSKIFGKDFSQKSINSDYKYSSKVIDKGVFLTTKLSVGHYGYSDGKSQSGVSGSITPEFIFGDQKRKFFDFTQLSLETEYSIRDGASPFKFDEFNSDSRLTIDLKQQIIGSLLGGFSASLNLNGDSSSFGKLDDKTFSLGISRRPYSINAYFRPEKEEIGFVINIFDFNYKGNSDKF